MPPMMAFNYCDWCQAPIALSKEVCDDCGDFDLWDAEMHDMPTVGFHMLTMLLRERQ